MWAKLKVVDWMDSRNCLQYLVSPLGLIVFPQCFPVFPLAGGGLVGSNFGLLGDEGSVMRYRTFSLEDEMFSLG